MVEMLQSAYVDSNDEVFPKILDVHTERSDNIADITFGQGTFWKKVDGVCPTTSDIDPESPADVVADCRRLPYDSSSFDAVVFDPPYTSGFYKEHNGKASGNSDYSQFRDAYTSQHTVLDGELHDEAQTVRKRHARVLDMYFRGIDEAKRVLRDDGILILKVQDEVSDNKSYMTHMETTDYAESVGFTTRDLITVVRPNKATTPHDNQHAALKRHSYFMIYDMEGGSLRG